MLAWLKQRNSGCGLTLILNSSWELMVYIISVLSIVRAPSLHFRTSCAHTHTHINTAFTIPLYAGSEVTPAVASHLADRLKSSLARFVLRRVFRCFLTNSLVRKTTMCTGIRFGFMVTHCLWNVLQEASRTDTASLSLSLSRHLNSQVQRGRKPKPNFLRLLQWDTLILPQLRGHIRREEREKERERHEIWRHRLRILNVIQTISNVTRPHVLLNQAPGTEERIRNKDGRKGRKKSRNTTTACATRET